MNGSKNVVEMFIHFEVNTELLKSSMHFFTTSTLSESR